MRVVREWVHRFLSTLRPARRDEDLAEELRLHTELASERGGRATGAAQAMDALRDQRGLPWIDDVSRDVSHGLRSLRRSPAFTTVALVTLALGIGANAAIFSIVKGVILQPLRYPHPEELVYLNTPTEELSQPEYLQIRDAVGAFAEVGAYTTREVNLTSGDRPLRARSAVVDGYLLSALAIQPAQGRLFARSETDVTGPWFPGNPGNASPPAVAILSHELWQTAFGGRPVVGDTVDVDNRRYEVIGVMPPGADLMDQHVAIWLPLGLNPAQRQQFPGYHFLNVVGRLKSGQTVQTAQSEVNAVLDDWAKPIGHEQHVADGHVHLAAAHEAIVGSAARPIWILQAAVGFVLLIACANLAHLLLARAETRRHEMAVRAALGAGRARLLRQSVTEGVLLSVAGGAIGLGLARALLDTLLYSYPGSLPRTTEVHIDLPVLFFTLGISVVTGVLFGLAPFAVTRATGVMAIVRAGGSRGGDAAVRRFVGRGLVVGEIALTVVLVAGAGLLVRTAYNLTAVDAGFEPSPLVTFSVSSVSPRRAQVYQQILETLRGVPGVEGATAVSGLPPTRPPDGEDGFIENYSSPDGDPTPSVEYYQSVMSDYFETMEIPIVQGRSFQPADAASSGLVAIVNETFVSTFWKGQNPIGQRLRPGWAEPWFTVIGVAKDVKQGGVDRPVGTEFYFFVEQMAIAPSPVGRSPATLNIVLRTNLGPSALSSTIANAVGKADPTVAVAQLQPMEDVLAQSISRPRLLAQVFGAFAGLALLLAAVGTYGVVSCTVSERRREIGIRMALGAVASGVLALVMRQGLMLMSIGLVLGLAGTVGMNQLVASLLFGVTPTDPVTFMIVVATIAVVGMVACWLPAWRASRLDPIAVLRAE